MLMQEVDLSKVWWNKRYRDDLGDLDSMVESMKDKGVLQPITVTPDLELLAGERRVTAARKAGLTTIPALIRPKADAIDAREVELLENLVRKDFTFVERCNLTMELNRLYKENNRDWSQAKTAQILDRSGASVSRDIKIAEAMQVLPELRTLKTADEALKVINKFEEQIIVGELRRRQVEQVGTGVGLDKGLQSMLKLADANYQVGDTFAGLAELPSGGDFGFTRFGIIECDPPYGIDLTEQKRSKDSVTSNVHTYQEVDKEAYPTFLKRLATELYRVAGQHTHLIFWFGPTWQHQVLTALTDAGWKVDDIPCLWVKNQGQTMQPKTYLGRAYEPFFLARKGQPTIIKEGRLNVFNFPSVAGVKKYHPTERPVAMIEEIFNTLGLPRTSVLVPFLGSGASLRAAYNCGMTGTGWDINGEYKDKFMLAVEQDTRAIGNNDGGDSFDEIAEDDGEPIIETADSDDESTYH